MNRIGFFLIFFCGVLGACKKNSAPITDTSVAFTVNGNYNGSLNYKGLNLKPKIQLNFSEAVDSTSFSQAIKLVSNGITTPLNFQLSTDKLHLDLTPKNNLMGLASYQLAINPILKTTSGGVLLNPITINLNTGIDSTDKFARITDDELLTKIQKQTFAYFWDFGHPNSGMARERNTSGDVVTTGGTGFGLMGIVVAINRSFITKAEGLARLQKIVTFLKTADKFHGVFPHWLNGNTGKVQPFSTKDNGADLVETSFLMEGLLVARQYFNGNDAAEFALRNDINQLYGNVEWDWFRNGGQEKLIWHWSPDYNWDINLQVKGWNEALMVYVLAASSTTHTIPKSVYEMGWAANGSMKNGNTYYGVTLPLGSANGGPLFFEHYSLMAINPNGLTDAYANYETQAKAHSKINYNYCVANPLNFAGYSADCWGLTASDINGGYTASSPNNDKGYIAPTAAVSSIPYTPEESLKAIRFFYYKLGDKVWGDYGFKDAFSLNDPWFASSYLAIDQGPQIVMIENYRTGLIWDLFMSCPEVKSGLTKLGFQSPKI
ncbi:MAG: Ig-like domain-containing protein [Bacteroidetes bacterium]|nr:Ig-like domain-containing protein [Bacteroidota bacterium]MBU1485624.1 Ig-like domain-containing protein [Bacteroidota bacterium]MBU1760539.1 Ig-like domain-containing protein [Bacteroidota bacterium]MBU2046235.1 Ig-like domain-containing protein [Bacteroidota bacterium]MBU2268915.1 Ig-like domain-containing protein [Bacteroidota bacterium]